MAKPITLFHVSDVHFGVENPAALDWFAAAVADERPDAVICTGDVTQRAKRSEFAAAREWFAKLGVPVTIEPGNHDMPYYNLWERFTRPYARFGALQSAVGALQLAVGAQLDLGGVAVVPLNSTVRAQMRFPWSDGVIREHALADTVDHIARVRGDHDCVIVACHHPLIPAKADAKNPTIGGDDAFAALADAGVDAVLSGHVHHGFDITRNAGTNHLRAIGAGTLSTRLRGVPPSYNVLTYVKNVGLEVARRDLAYQA